MFVVGVTGGIGSGKTTATDHFASLGIDIVDADIASRVVVEPGKPALHAIAEHFGPDILHPDGQLNRAELRQRIFLDSDEKLWLEALLHPRIAEEINQSLHNASSPYVIFVSPLMVESGQKKLCDRLLVIDVPEELQIHRTTARDSNDREQVERIMASQASRTDRLKYADDIIENHGDVDALQRQVEALHQQYLELAQLKAQTSS